MVVRRFFFKRLLKKREPILSPSDESVLFLSNGDQAMQLTAGADND